MATIAVDLRETIGRATTVALDDIDGRRFAESIVAPTPRPPHDDATRNRFAVDACPRVRRADELAFRTESLAAGERIRWTPFPALEAR